MLNTPFINALPCCQKLIIFDSNGETGFEFIGDLVIEVILPDSAI